MTYQDTARAHAHAIAEEDVGPAGAGYLVPVVGGSILTLLWGAYTLMIVYHMLTLPLP
jgi:hypothetical protein